MCVRDRECVQRVCDRGSECEETERRENKACVRDRDRDRECVCSGWSIEDLSGWEVSVNT